MNTPNPKRFSGKKLLRYLLLAAAIAALIYFLFHFYKKQDTQPPQFPTPVDTDSVQILNWQPEINTIGTLNAMQGIVVKAETSGRITQIFFESGKYIEAGSPLVQVYPDTLQAQLAADLANLKLSKLEYSREKELFEKGVGTRSALDTARAKMDANEAQVEQTQAALDQTLIRAPFSGRLGLGLVELGDFISPGDSIVNLQNLDPMRVDFRIPEVYLSQLALDQTVVVTARSFPNEKFVGKVYAFESVIDPDTRSLAIRATLPNQNHKLLPGIFVHVSLQLSQPEPMITVPQTAVVYDEEGDYVYRVVDNHAIKTVVKLGPMYEERIAILEGLHKGDIVVAAGQLKISDGALIVDRKAMQPSSPPAQQ